MSTWIEPYPRLTFLQKAGRLWPQLLCHARTQWLGWAALACLVCLFSTNYRVMVNGSESLPYQLFLVRLDTPVPRGGLAVFKLKRKSHLPDGAWMLKRALAVPGDTVTRRGLDYLTENAYLAGKSVGLSGQALRPNAELKEGKNTLPPGKYFMGGDHVESFDSRYDTVGLVDAGDIAGRAYAIF